jgi:predicted nuclease of predicted toxin-antitoxin system
MRFLADMGISPRVVEELRRNGHAPSIWQSRDSTAWWMATFCKSAAGGRVLLTHDLDFGELLAASGGVPSVIIFSSARHALRKCQPPPQQHSQSTIEALAEGRISVTDESPHS